ncbi:hypothetical protein L6164_010572 [Bauhinia variegata]|uniref:Uncharacterized protein n=1 Tax=Bauhinia variegata TaxID=167791 RepID=A0ACB9PNQ0_BAUVA|nr:hypothetical protein L6164_010572 [Bauhinia variegata]
MIPACFGQPTTPRSSSQCQLSQNLITCIYQIQLCNSPSYVTLSWSRTLFSHSLTIYASDAFSTTISLNSSTLSFFRTRPSSKSIYLTRRHFQKIKLYWDFTRAQFCQNYAEPESCFYIAISCNDRLEFFLGDLFDDFIRRSAALATTHQPTDPIILSRREHVFGSRSYTSRAQFLGSKHEIEIEYNGGMLRVKVDGKIRLVVKRLAWKFRGNEKIFIDDVEVEFYWDVFTWVNNSNGNYGNGHGVFVFQVGDGGVWPEIMGQEKRLMGKSLSVSSGPAMISLSPSPSNSSVLQWAEESSSDGGRSSCSSSTRSCGSNANSGFSLLLYAWRRD